MYEMHLAEGLTALHNPAQSMLGYSIPLVGITGFGSHSLGPHLHGLHSGSCLWYEVGPEGGGMEGKVLTPNTEAQITHHGHV